MSSSLVPGKKKKKKLVHKNLKFKKDLLQRTLSSQTQSYIHEKLFQNFENKNKLYLQVSQGNLFEMLIQG